MHFGFALHLSDTNMWNIDLPDTHLNLLDTDILSKHFVSLHDVFKTSSRHAFKTSSRCLQDMSSRCHDGVFSVTIFRLSRRLQDILKDKKLLRWRRVEGVFKTCLKDIFKTSSRPVNVCWDVPWVQFWVIAT